MLEIIIYIIAVFLVISALLLMYHMIKDYIKNISVNREKKLTKMLYKKLKDDNIVVEYKKRKNYVIVNKLINDTLKVGTYKEVKDFIKKGGKH